MKCARCGHRREYHRDLTGACQVIKCQCAGYVHLFFSAGMAAIDETPGPSRLTLFLTRDQLARRAARDRWK